MAAGNELEICEECEMRLGDCMCDWQSEPTKQPADSCQFTVNYKPSKGEG